MSSEPQKLTDYGRVLLGDVPWTFALEVVLRIGVIYLVLVVAMRVMGKRMASQTSRNELAALVSLAGGVGPAIQDPKNGLLPSMIVACVVVGFQRVVAHATKNHERLEQITQGSMSTLVHCGVIDMKALRKAAISRQRILSQLRAAQFTNLGAVDRVYFEINGAFTIIQAAEPCPGLSLVPIWDEDLRREQRTVPGKLACARCGHVVDDDHGRERRCDRCGRDAWEAAVLE